MNKVIMLVDGSPTVHKIVELTFADAGIHIESATTGSQAIDMLGRLEPDLVLADVTVDGPSGYDICRQVKSAHPAIPVVLLAGTFEPFDFERARDCGADGHLVKPFEVAALQTKIEALLDIGAAEPSPPAEALHEPAAPSVIPVSERDEPAGGGDSGRTLSADDVEAVARAVVRRLGPDSLREVARELLPEMAEKIIRERIRELESEE